MITTISRTILKRLLNGYNITFDKSNLGRGPTDRLTSKYFIRNYRCNGTLSLTHEHIRIPSNKKKKHHHSVKKCINCQIEYLEVCGKSIW